MIAFGRTITLCIIASLLLGACGSSPPVRYFSLSPSQPHQDQDTAIVLGLGPLRVPEYLNRSQLVTRGNGSELEVHEFSRWAEPLDSALHRVLSADVDSIMDNVAVYPFPWETLVNKQVHYRLLGDIMRFEADRTGRVVLEVQWGVTSVESSEPVVAAQRATYEAQSGSADDPAAITAAMNDALAQFGRDVADKFGSAL